MDPPNNPPPADDDEIAFEVVEPKDAPPVQDPSTNALRHQVTRKIERELIEDKTREDLGVKKEPFTPIPKDVPVMVFRFGSMCIKCPAFCLDEEEAQVLTTHINRICEYFHINVGIAGSIVIVLIVIVSKLIACKDAIMSMFTKKPKEEPA
jgi:hypothetical protein